jgi:hypothetical protein
MTRLGLLLALLVLPLTALTPGHVGWLIPRAGQASVSSPAPAPAPVSREQALDDAAWRWRDCRPHHWRDCLLQH